ncbi:hypothetical protein Vafri_10923 [Volvox africanus]|uniref:BFN domain-containing protein n=1 Tax=Volvox africanus TaxID=51714 RepID=A0A8J4B772_9CHLO|nr:hypothetical protein Vafri_10923 [Volvox africanus]
MQYQFIPSTAFNHNWQSRPSLLLLRNDCYDSCEQARQRSRSFILLGRTSVGHSTSSKRVRPLAAGIHKPPSESIFSPHLSPQQPPQPSTTPKSIKTILSSSCTSSSSSSCSSSFASPTPTSPHVHQESVPDNNYTLAASPQSVPSSSSSRRVVLLASASSALLLLLPLVPPECALIVPRSCPSASARLLHSKRSDLPCYLTIRNRRPGSVDARWVNYDGDEESYAIIPPGHAWTVETYETHPWRFRDARTGDLLCEYVAQRGDRLVQLYDDPVGLLDSTPGSSSRGSSNNTIVGAADLEDGGDWRHRQRQQRRRQPSQYDTQPPPDVPDQLGQISTASGAAADVDPHHQSLSHSLLQSHPEQRHQQLPPPPAVSERPGLAGGFDGLGNPAEQYTSASLLSVAVLPQESQAVVVLGLTGFVHPLSLLVGVSEARNIVNAAGSARGRRPTLLATWLQTVQALGGTLERVVITRQVGGIFYARIVLSQPYWGLPAADAARSVPTPPSGDHAHARHAGEGQGEGEGRGEGFLVSVDARTSDALALALEAGAEVFVSRPVAELVQQQYLDVEQDMAEQLLLLPPQQMLAEGKGDGKGEGKGEGGRRFLAAEGQLRAPLA